MHDATALEFVARAVLEDVQQHNPSLLGLVYTGGAVRPFYPVNEHHLLQGMLRYLVQSLKVEQKARTALDDQIARHCFAIISVGPIAPGHRGAAKYLAWGAATGLAGPCTTGTGYGCLSIGVPPRTCIRESRQQGGK